MKILYLTDTPFSLDKGVFNKIYNQIKIWQKAGNKVDVYSLHDGNFLKKKNRYEIKHNTGSNKLKTFLNYQINSYKISRHLKQNKYDIIYSRYLLFSPYLIKIISNNKFIFEINSFERTEYLRRSKLTYYYYLLTKYFIEKNSTGYIFISNELKDLNKKKLIKKNIVIGNGLEITKQPRIKPIGDNVVFIGSKQHYWNGFDKILKLAQMNQNITFNIIGIEGRNEKNIVYHGKLFEEDAKKIIRNSILGISTLALYRKNMNEASPLKSRLYLSEEIPIVYGYIDTDLNGDEKFTLKICNSKKRIDNKVFIDFYNYVKVNRALIKNEIKNFNKKHLSNEIKEIKRLNFMKECMG